MRLSRVLGSLVGPDQTCSVPGHSIASNVTLLRNVLDYVEWTDESGILASLDQEKVFDGINHSFLFRLLEHLGFASSFIKHVDTLYTVANMRIILNSHLSGKIKLKRGVRQGDLLSPLLYVLCLGVLASQIRSSPFASGFLLPGTSGAHFCVRQYTDNTIFPKNVSSLVQLFNLVSIYERGSGVKLNHSKTEAMWPRRMDEPLGLMWVKKMKVLRVWFGVVPVEKDSW